MKIFTFLILSVFVFIQGNDLVDVRASVINLDETIQDFVLETKQIKVPGFPGAFNACIVKWRNSYLMSYRVRNSKLVSTFEIGFVWLDKEFNCISVPRILVIKNDSSPYKRHQDPRIFVIGEDLYILYSNFINFEETITRRMFLAQVQYEHDSFFIDNPECLESFEGSGKRWEKNWVPFLYEGNLLLAYSLLPHRILQLSPERGECFTVHFTRSAITWDWGDLRGGTPASLDGEEYLAFFHSSRAIATTQSYGKKIPHYVMGAYTFSAKPPFEITRISPVPIMAKSFYDGPAYNTWKPLRVVFPMSYLSDENYIWVAYGKQDHEIWVAKLDKKGLYDSLVTCPLTNDGNVV